MKLITTNLDTEPLTIDEALHTYFRIGDIGQARVLGLEGCAYVDKVAGGMRRRQESPITSSGETDRVYVDSKARCVIEDPVGLRKLNATRAHIPCDMIAFDATFFVARNPITRARCCARSDQGRDDRAGGTAGTPSACPGGGRGLRGC